MRLVCRAGFVGLALVLGLTVASAEPLIRLSDDRLPAGRSSHPLRSLLSVPRSRPGHPGGGASPRHSAGGIFRAGQRHPRRPDNPAASLLYQRISHADAAMRMPPAHSRKPLKTEQIERLRKWIEEGASWDQHWSFKAIRRSELPR